jgi:hypothetical protein
VCRDETLAPSHNAPRARLRRDAPSVVVISPLSRRWWRAPPRRAGVPPPPPPPPPHHPLLSLFSPARVRHQAAVVTAAATPTSIRLFHVNIPLLPSPLLLLLPSC